MRVQRPSVLHQQLNLRTPHSFLCDVRGKDRWRSSCAKPERLVTRPTKTKWGRRAQCEAPSVSPLMSRPEEHRTLSDRLPARQVQHRTRQDRDPYAPEGNPPGLQFFTTHPQGHSAFPCSQTIEKSTIKAIAFMVDFLFFGIRTQPTTTPQHAIINT